MTKGLATLTSAIALSFAFASTASADALDFDGFYGGLSLGFVGLDPNFSASSVDSAVGYDVFVGYNHALNSQWIVGAELSYGASGDHDVSGSATVVNLEDMVTLSARAGYVFDRTMIFGRLGYQTGEMSVSTSALAPDLDGPIFGLGVEHMFSDSVSGRFEVTHSILDLSGSGVPSGFDLERTAVSIGIAFHF